MIFTKSTDRGWNHWARAVPLVALLVCVPVLGAEGEDPADPEAAPEMAPRTKDDCDRWLAAAAQGEGASDATSWPKMEETLDDLVVCNAVARNSTAACATLKGHAAADCSVVVSTFEQLKSNPDGRSFVFPEEAHSQCSSDPELGPHCDAIRDAAVSNDPSKCPPGMLEQLCQALVSLDNSICRKIVEPQGASKECLRQVAKLAPYAAGLDKLAASGAQPFRTFAKAALGDKDACSALAEKASGACIASVPEPEDPPEPPAAQEGDADEPAGEQNQDGEADDSVTL